MKIFAFTLALFVGFSAAFPQKEGSAFTQKALQTIQDRQLIPANARIDRVSKTFIKNHFPNNLTQYLYY